VPDMTGPPVSWYTGSLDVRRLSFRSARVKASESD
jgi:hypothetical protein